MGVIAIMSVGILRNPGCRKWIGFVAVLLMMMFVLPVSIFGFLYVTTDMHQKMIEGDTTHAAKND